jgi:hypothetical protein
MIPSVFAGAKTWPDAIQDFTVGIKLKMLQTL